jgi:hypothetical protein
MKNAILGVWLGFRDVLIKPFDMTGKRLKVIL